MQHCERNHDVPYEFYYDHLKLQIANKMSVESHRRNSVPKGGREKEILSA